LEREIVVEQVDIEVGVDELVLDVLPDDPGHLVAVHFDDGILHLDLRHFNEPPFESRHRQRRRIDERVDARSLKTQPGSRGRLYSIDLLVVKDALARRAKSRPEGGWPRSF